MLTGTAISGGRTDTDTVFGSIETTIGLGDSAELGEAKPTGGVFLNGSPRMYDGGTRLVCRNSGDKGSR